MRTRRRPELCITPGFLLLLAVAVLVCEDGLLVCGLGAMLIHEAGHAAMLCISGGGLARLRLTLFGGVMEPAYPLCLSPAKEAAVCLAGPGANLLTVPLFALAGSRSEWGYILAGLSLSAGIFNLLPISGLDGGRALLFAMSGRPRAAEMLRRLTLYAGFALLCPGVVLLCSRFHNPTLAIFGLWAIFRAIRPDSSCEAEDFRV